LQCCQLFLPVCHVPTSIYYNGKEIHTSDRSIPKIAEFSVQHGHFHHLGPNLSQKYPFDSTTLINLNHTTVLPGLIDSHAHLLLLGASLTQAKISGSIEEIRDVLIDYVLSNPDKKWVIGRSWNQLYFPFQSFPTYFDLSHPILDGHPILLYRVDEHAVWINKHAMDLIPHIPEKDPNGGQILRGKDGEASGVFIDAAMDLICIFANLIRSKSSSRTDRC
jgi:predicted amidohydrolase YtcJ